MQVQGDAVGVVLILVVCYGAFRIAGWSGLDLAIGFFFVCLVIALALKTLGAIIREILGRNGSHHSSAATASSQSKMSLAQKRKRLAGALVCTTAVVVGFWIYVEIREGSSPRKTASPIINAYRAQTVPTAGGRGSEPTPDQNAGVSPSPPTAPEDPPIYVTDGYLMGMTLHDYKGYHRQKFGDDPICRTEPPRPPTPDCGNCFVCQGSLLIGEVPVDAEFDFVEWKLFKIAGTFDPHQFKTVKEALVTRFGDPEIDEKPCEDPALRRDLGLKYTEYMEQVAQSSGCESVGWSNRDLFVSLGQVPLSGKRLEVIDMRSVRTTTSPPPTSLPTPTTVNEPQKAANSVEVTARGLSVVPGAIICPNHDTTSLMFELYVAHWEDTFNDKLTNGQTRLLHGAPRPVPDFNLHGCALVPPGTPMMLEKGNILPVVTAKLPDGTTIRGVTLSGMFESR